MGIFQKLGECFFSHKFPMVGVDISDTSIELIQLQASLGKPKIKVNSRLELEPGLIINGRISDAGNLAVILKAAFKKETFKSNYCLLSLPDKETYFLSIKAKDLDTEIYSQAQENLPIDLQQCYYDYIKTSNESAFFAAAPKQIIKQYLDVFKLAELNLQVVDFESACLARTLITLEEMKEPTFIIDLGAKSTDIILVDWQGFNDQINFALGGYFISQKIADNLRQDFDQAEKIKLEKGIKIQGLDLEAIITEMYQPVFAEINKMSSKYETEKNIKPIKIILAGGTCLLKGLVDIFKKNLPGYDINLGNLEKKIDFKDKSLGKEQILYANVIGLALRGINDKSLNQGINLIKNFSA